MSVLWVRAVAWALAGATALSAVAMAVLGSQRRGEALGDIQPFRATEAFFFGGAFFAFALLGALIVSRRSRNRIGWVFLAVGFAELFAAFGTEYGIHGLLRAPGSLVLAAEVLWLSDLVGSTGFAFFPLFFLLFPNGSLLGPRWRVVVAAVWLSAAMLALHSLLTWDLRGPRLLSPVEVDDVGWIDYLGEVAFPIVTFALLAGAMSLILRFRRGSVEERQQVKWLAYAGAVFATLMLLDGVEVLPESHPVALVAAGISVVMLPIGAGVAILKYRLYDIDLVINRTLVYGTLTVILAAGYLGLVVVLQELLSFATKESDLAIAASTLAIAALFRPLRTRIQNFIDHRFYRRKYDTAETLERFTGRLREQVDLASLSRELVAVVGTTMQPAHAGLWLRGSTDPTPKSIR